MIRKDWENMGCAIKENKNLESLKRIIEIEVPFYWSRAKSLINIKIIFFKE